MAKCKECFHYLVCKFWDNEDKECSQFKGASSCVEAVRCKDCEYRKKDDVGRNYCGLGDFYCGETDYYSRGKRKMVSLEDIVDLDAQTKANNEAMRKVIDFIAGERKDQ